MQTDQTPAAPDIPDPSMVPTVERLRRLERDALAELDTGADTQQAFGRWERHHLGRTAELSRLRAGLSRLPRPQRAPMDRELRRVRARLVAVLNGRRTRAAQRDRLAAAAAVGADPTMPPPDRSSGGLHPITLLTDQTARYFAKMGFSLQDSSQLEDIEHSFDLLGVAPDHVNRSPARTFHVGPAVLRSHTTASVLRVLAELGTGQPLRFAVTGPCHRNAPQTPRAVPQFHQFEAVAVGPSVRMSDLTEMALGYLEEVLGDDCAPRLRFRALPYAIPGIAVDVGCRPCAALGCALCRGSGRLEVGGGGLLTPQVLRIGGDHPQMRGVALALSLERILAVRYGLGDVRHFLRNELRVLTQLH